MNLEAVVCRHCGADVPEGADRCPICGRIARRPWLPGWTLPGLALALCAPGILVGLAAPPLGLGFGVIAILTAGLGMAFQSRLRYPALAVALITLLGLGAWWQFSASDLQAMYWQAHLSAQIQQTLLRVLEK